MNLPISTNNTTYYGFVSAPDATIRSVSNREPGEWNLATCNIYEGSPPFDLPMDQLTSDILFIAKSKKESEVKEAVEAVRNVYNSWCLDKVIENPPIPPSMRFQRRSDWSTTALSCTNAKKGFVYIYRLCPDQDNLQDEAFYVGMSGVGNRSGITSRECYHINETRDKKNQNRSLSSKHTKIYSWLVNNNLITGNGEKLSHSYKPEEHNLVNRIAEGISKIAALAIENFLINHYYGVFKLSNGTNGNADLKGTGMYFLSRPRVITNSNNTTWINIVSNFLQLDGELRQTDKFELQLMALSDDPNFSNRLRRASMGRLLPEGPPSNIATDVEWSWTFAPEEGPQWIRFQLKFSAAHAAVIINLRPRSRMVKEFREGIENIWQNPTFGNVDDNGIYFKPFGRPQKSKTVDTKFSYDDLDEASIIATGYPKLVSEDPDIEQQELELTLPQAIARLTGSFHICN